MENFKNGKGQQMKFSDGGTGIGGTVKIPRLLGEMKIRLVEVKNKRSEKSPDYIVETVDIDLDGNGYWAESGSGWKKPLNNPTELSEFLISIDLDMADMPNRIPLSAYVADEEFQTKDGPKVWRFNYTRPRPRRERRAENSKDNPLKNDSIEF